MTALSSVVSRPDHALQSRTTKRQRGQQLVVAALSSAKPSIIDDNNDDTQTPALTLTEQGARRKTIFRCQGYGDCEMMFFRSEHLARHVRKHTGQKPFKCHCDKSFTRLDNLRQHTLKRHANRPELNASTIAACANVHSQVSFTSIQNQVDAGMVIAADDALVLAMSSRRAKAKANTPGSSPPELARKSNSASPSSESAAAASSLAAMAGGATKCRSRSTTSRKKISVSPSVRQSSTSPHGTSHLSVPASHSSQTTGRSPSPLASSVNGGSARHPSPTAPVMMPLPPPASSVWNSALPAPEAYFPAHSGAPSLKDSPDYTSSKEHDQASCLPPTPHSLYGGETHSRPDAAMIAATTGPWSSAVSSVDSTCAYADTGRPLTSSGRGVTLPSISHILPGSTSLAEPSHYDVWDHASPSYQPYDSRPYDSRPYDSRPYDGRQYPAANPYNYGPPLATSAQPPVMPTSTYDYRPPMYDNVSQAHPSAYSYAVTRPLSSHGQWYGAPESTATYSLPASTAAEYNIATRQSSYAPYSMYPDHNPGWTSAPPDRPSYAHYPSAPHTSAAPGSGPTYRVTDAPLEAVTERASRFNTYPHSSSPEGGVTTPAAVSASLEATSSIATYSL
ncbi:Up in starvation [Microbotryomycetes sp. JL221]|nr:Up in starvation [Microbotryomycetes sp. JL221]